MPANANNTSPRVLVTDDHAQARESIADILRIAGYDVACASSAAEALLFLDGNHVDVIVTDLQMPGMSGLEFIQRIQLLSLQVEIVMVTAHASISTAVDAMRLGAFDYLEKPLDADKLEACVQRAVDRRRILAPTPPCDRIARCDAMIGSSTAMRNLRERIARVAPTDETILIVGESGVGKELVAQAIHAASGRSNSPLVSLNCPVLSAQLMESELFGHAKGAFTGATEDRVGRFELADGGTLLLDEVTEIESPLQSKLLRVLQERSFERVGCSESIATDVRVLATTNRDLPHEIESGRFREDLYYRLAVIPVEVPPLRDRAEDVAELTDHFLAIAADRLKRPISALDDSARELLADYRWPGNVRELKNIITRASVLGGDEPISAKTLRPWLAPNQHADITPVDAPPELPVGTSLEELERQMIETTLEHFDGHRSKTAEALGIGVRTLSSKLKSYGYAPREKNFNKAA